MVNPSYLEKKQKIAIVAPATSVKPEEISNAVEIFESWGLEIVFGKYLFENHHGFAGTDVQRASDFQDMLDNPEIKAIICARGGYGTLRIIDKLDFSTFSKNPKWVVGFSDVTVLHCHLYNLGSQSIHGSMPLLFPQQTKDSIHSLYQALFGEKINYISENINPFNRLGEVEATIVGGNLSLFTNTIGTNTEVDTKGKILFLEDVDEYIYHLDRMLIHLKRAGKLTNLAGLVVGQFSELMDNEPPFGKTVHEIIDELTKEYSYPILYDFPTGHENHNIALIVGAKVKLGVLKNEVKLMFI